MNPFERKARVIRILSEALVGFSGESLAVIGKGPRKRSKNPVLCESSELFGIQRFRKSRAVCLKRSVCEPLKFDGVGK